LLGETDPSLAGDSLADHSEHRLGEASNYQPGV